VRLTEDHDLRRRRAAVLFRLLLLVPVVVVALLYALVAVVVFPFAWLTALALGRVSPRQHQALAAALEYQARATAWTTLVSGRYPWPTRRREHPVRLVVERERQRRSTVILRLPLALPALALATSFAAVLAGTAVGAWFVALVFGRTTEGLRELGAFCLRYVTETTSYLLLLTPRYPSLAARVEDHPLAEPQTAQ
jgi:Domain of unknown function (DUF4389)